MCVCECLEYACVSKRELERSVRRERERERDRESERSVLVRK